jgi:hypothetical protein
VPVHDSQTCSGVFDLGACKCQCIECPCWGSRYGGGVPVISSSETETGSRGRSALDRDGASLEGASGPRERRNPARGSVQPSSEAEPHPRGRPVLERGDVVPVRRRTPRAKRSSARGWLGQLSGGPWVRGFVLRVCLGSFVFVFYEFKRVFPGCLGDAHGCPRQMSSALKTSFLCISNNCDRE